MKTKCILIGPQGSPVTSEAAKALDGVQVRTRAFSLNGFNYQAIIEACKAEQELGVVGLLTNINSTNSIALIRMLKDALPTLPIHVLREGIRHVRPSDAELKNAGVRDVYENYPIKSAEAAGVIARRWFPGIMLPPELAAVSKLARRRMFEASELLAKDDAESETEDFGSTEPPRSLNARIEKLIAKDPPKGRSELRPPPHVHRQSNRASRRAAIFVRPEKPAPKAPAPSVPPLEARPAEHSAIEKWKPIIDRIRKAIAEAVYVKVSPSLIDPLPGQPRKYFDPASLKELADSIRSIGQMQVGMLRKKGDRYELLDGERRWRSGILAGVDEYRAMLIEIDDEAAPFVVSSIANFHHENHTPLEISDAIERLHNGLGIPIPEVAKMYGIGYFWAYKLHSLQKLHPKIRNMLDPHLKKTVQLPITAAIEVAKLEQSVQSELVDRYRQGKVSLAGMRREAHLIAKSTGTYIRTRSDEPARKAKRAENKANVLLGMAEELKGYLQEETARKSLSQHPRVASTIVDVIKEIEDVLRECRLITVKCT